MPNNKIQHDATQTVILTTQRGLQRRPDDQRLVQKAIGNQVVDSALTHETFRGDGEQKEESGEETGTVQTKVGRLVGGFLWEHVEFGYQGQVYGSTMEGKQGEVRRGGGQQMGDQVRIGAKKSFKRTSSGGETQTNGNHVKPRGINFARRKTDSGKQ